MPKKAALSITELSAIEDAEAEADADADTDASDDDECVICANLKPSRSAMRNEQRGVLDKNASW